MESDKRMQWILAFDDCQTNDSEKCQYIDYEICTEVRIPGVLEYGNFLHCVFYDFDKNEDGFYTYIVRIKFPNKKEDFSEDNYSKKGYYFVNGIIGELLVIFSFYFQTRFYLRATISGDISEADTRMRSSYKFNNQKINESLGKLINKEMFSSDSNKNWANEDLKKFLDDIRKINQKYHQGLIRSFYWYSEAIKEVGINHQLFFIKMVSAVEALLIFENFEKDDLHKKIEKLIDGGVFLKNENDELCNWLNNRSISKRFRQFIKKYSVGFFKGGKRKAEHCCIRKNKLDEYLRRIYSARSKYLHEGIPMYLSMDLNDKSTVYWDVDPTQGKMIDRSRIDGKTKLPRTRWFERIVNYSIKKFINTLS